LPLNRWVGKLFSLMKPDGCSVGLVWKRRIVTLLAAFFVLYAILDISVLQAYCGNEALGIPPYAAQLRLDGERSRQSSVREKGIAGVSQSPDEKPTNDTPISDDACFCCCSHTTLAVKLFAPVAKRPDALPSEANFSKKNLHPDSHPSPHYQPPKSS